jgi:hypothetical protein
MPSSLTRCARSACGIAVFALFVGCGGSTDPGLFSAGSTAGSSSHAGASADGGASAHGGAASGGASSSGGRNAAGEGSTEGGAENGGSSDAGSSNAGAGGAAQAGASSAGSNAGGSAGATGGAANGGTAGSTANAGSGGDDGETCQTLFAKASKQLAAAQVCNLAANSLQCTSTAPNLCKCEVLVNREESAETKAYRATLDQLDKKKCVQVCSALACFPANHATCKASSPGSTAGTCVTSYAVPL